MLTREALMASFGARHPQLPLHGAPPQVSAPPTPVSAIGGALTQGGLGQTPPPLGQNQLGMEPGGTPQSLEQPGQMHPLLAMLQQGGMSNRRARL